VTGLATPILPSLQRLLEIRDALEQGRSAQYEVIRERYSSDLSDAEFALIFPLLPAPKRRGRKPTCPREILNALFYLIRSGLSLAADAQ
jgi:hypothetical protein